MLKIVIAVTAFAAATNASAQTPARLPGVWAVGEPDACATGNAWVFFKEDLYAEVKLPDGPISSLGHWRDEGTALANSHAHMPFTKLAEGQPEPRMTFKSRTAGRFEATAPSDTVRVFSRCLEGTLKAPANAGAH